MKILHIINTLETGGAQSVLAQLLEGWGNESDLQMVISLRQREPLSGRIEALNIPVEYINLQPDKIELKKFIQLISIIKKFKPDIVQTWLYHADLIGGVAARLAGHTPIVWGVHHTTTGSTSVKPVTWHVIQLLSWLSTILPSHIVCCSESAYQTHINLGYPKNRMSTIVNGVDTRRFRPDPNARAIIRNKLGLSSQIKLIGMFARYHPQKDHDTLVYAAGIFLKRNPNVHFVFAGEGINPSNVQLRHRVSQTGLSNNFHLLGNRQDMPRLNAGMDIVTLSSSYGEALPVTLSEAMSCGIPCVATNVGDTPTLIGNTGMVVEPKNPQALADAWQNILDLSEIDYHQLCNLARQRVLKSYNLENMIRQYRFIYQELKKTL